MYILAMMIILGGYVGLLILQTAQNISISFTLEEKAAIKAAIGNFIERFRNGISNRQRNNRGA